MDCNSCKKNAEGKSVPYIVYEAEAARHERTVKRLIIAVVVSIILIVLTNIAWIWAWMQYDYSGEEIIVDAGNGTANYIGNDGDINNGTNNSTKTNSD